MTGPISVIVPTLDEEDRIEGALRSARRAFGDDVELLVVDGGSTDATRSRAEPMARVLEADAGRGTQLDAGARAARGQVLVFLHADTRLPAGAGAPLRSLLAEPGVAGGCFRFAVHPRPRGLDRWRLLEIGVRLRTRLFRTATGDQVLFTTRRAYREAGGFPPWPLFEDVELVRRLRRVGRFRILAVTAATSRRRWRSAGFWRTVAAHWALRIAFALGVDPHRLGGWYDRLTTGRGAEGSSGPDRGSVSRPPNG